jgi:hypothetical protein
MTDTATRLPDLLVRTTARGDRFGWRLVTLEGDSFLNSVQQAESDGSPSDYATRTEARQAAGAVLLALVQAQPERTTGEIVEMRTPAGPARLAA